MRAVRTALLAAVVLGVAGCTVPQRFQIGGRTGFGGKVIDSKEEPSTLWAVDGTMCMVTKNKFDAAKAGDRVWCTWQERGGSVHAGPDRPVPST